MLHGEEKLVELGEVVWMRPFGRILRQSFGRDRPFVLLEEAQVKVGLQSLCFHVLWNADGVDVAARVEVDPDQADVERPVAVLAEADPVPDRVGGVCVTASV